MNFPPITALMITGIPVRKRFAQKAFDAWVNQTYPNKKIVIVNTDFVPWFSNITKNFPDQVQELVLASKPEEEITLGELRNISVAASTTDLVIQWDDDDYCLPDRITSQYAAMYKLNTPCCLLANQIRAKFYSPDEAYYYRGDIHRKRFGGIEGTILYDKTKMIAEYPQLTRGEDTAFLSACGLDLKQIAIAVNNPMLYIRWYHGLNTWGEKHFFNTCKDLPVTSSHHLETLIRIAESY